MNTMNTNDDDRSEPALAMLSGPPSARECEASSFSFVLISVHSWLKGTRGASGARLFRLQLHCHPLQRLLQLSVAKLSFRHSVAAQGIPPDAPFFKLFEFLVRHHDFVARIGTHAPIVRVFRVGIAVHGLAVGPIVDGDGKFHRADATLEIQDAS